MGLISTIFVLGMTYSSQVLSKDQNKVSKTRICRHHRLKNICSNTKLSSNVGWVESTSQCFGHIDISVDETHLRFQYQIGDGRGPMSVVRFILPS